MRSTRLPKVSSVTTASSATGRSLVPAQITPMRPSRRGQRFAFDDDAPRPFVVAARRETPPPPPRSAPASPACRARPARARGSSARWRRPRRASCPGRKMTSGKPQRRWRSVSTRAKPRSTKGGRGGRKGGDRSRVRSGRLFQLDRTIHVPHPPAASGGRRVFHASARWSGLDCVGRAGEIFHLVRRIGKIPRAVDVFRETPRPGSAASRHRGRWRRVCTSIPDR